MPPTMVNNVLLNEHSFRQLQCLFFALIQLDCCLSIAVLAFWVLDLDFL